MYFDKDRRSRWKHNKNNNVHEACGFTFTTVSDFFEARTVTYRGSDAGKVFLERILKEENRIKKLLREANEEMILTEEDEIKYDKETRCHICGDEFSPEKKNMEHLENLKDWLEINYLDIKKVPTMGEVRKVHLSLKKICSS